MIILIFLVVGWIEKNGNNKRPNTYNRRSAGFKQTKNEVSHPQDLNKAVFKRLKSGYFSIQNTKKDQNTNFP